MQQSCSIKFEGRHKKSLFEPSELYAYTLIEKISFDLQTVDPFN